MAEASGAPLARRRFGLVARLTLEDYAHEWVLSSCSVLAFAAVLIPLLVLFGLKYGIIANLLEPLVENPRYREITPVASGNFAPDWFARIGARSDVAFVVPRTRSLAASIKLRAPQADVGRILDVELIPSAASDPVLGAVDAAPAGYAEVVIATSAARKLGVTRGDRIEGIVTRTRSDQQESERLPLLIVGEAPLTAFARDGLFVSGDLLSAVEDFLDGRAVAALGWQGAEPRPADRAFAGFRLYARTIGDVEGLRGVFAEEGIEVRTNAADIALVQTLDRNLGVVYWIIALIAVSGYGLSFASTIWANVDRKRHEFSVLRLMGFRTREIVWFPILQAAFTAGLAWLLGCLVFFAVQGALNALFATTIGGGEAICRLEPWHLLAALAMTLAAALAAATLGGRRVAELEPAIGLRGD